MDSTPYRRTDEEQARTSDLLRLLPRGRRSVLEIGARDGHHSGALTAYFESVTALDLETPTFAIEGVTNAKGDVTALSFADNSFDCVLCAEVLEHVPAVEKAAAEIARVARHEVLIGVPYRQDTRVGKLTCQKCGKVTPAYGHINRFDENRLANLFSSLSIVDISLVSTTLDRTNILSSILMNVAGNPWGTYGQDEPCIHCGAPFALPPPPNHFQKICSAVAFQLDRIQSLWVKPASNWIHILFRKGETR
jgi:SAM-dependent methyltransferase